MPAIDFAGLRAKLGVPRPLDILIEVEKLEPTKRKWSVQTHMGSLRLHAGAGGLSFVNSLIVLIGT